MGAIRLLLAFIFCVAADTASGQSTQPPSPDRGYPDRPIKYVVPFQAGSSLDVVARIIAQKLSESLGQAVVVENRPGAGGNVGADFVAKAAPDGYTLLHTINSLAASPALYRNLSFDPVRDLAPIVGVAAQPFILVVNPSSPYKTVKELIDLARANPGKLSFGSSGAGSLDHLAGELFNSMAGTKMLHVPYKGGPAVQLDIMAGRIDMTFTGMGAGVPQLKAGKLRGLAVSASKRARLLPETPTVSEAGLRDFEVVNSNAIYAPGNTPRAIVTRLNEEVLRILRLPDIRERFDNLGVEAIGGTPEDLAAVLKADIAQWKKVIEEAGIRPEN